MITITEKGLRIQTSTTVVEFEQDRIISIQDARNGDEYLDRKGLEILAGFELLHQNGKFSPLGAYPQATQLHYNLLTDHIAEMMINDWECDISIRISVDEENGDVLIEPSAWSMQGGVAGLAMNIAGLRQNLQVVGPFQQGFRLPVDHPMLAKRLAAWPSVWEAGFLIFDGDAAGFTIQTWDERFLFKAIQRHPGSPRTMQFLTLAPGPLEMNRCVGNLCWRISAYQGNWQVPVRRYRDWYWQAHQLEKAARLRPEWLDNIRLAVSWCPTDLNLLDALAKRVDPQSVFLHLPNWRIYTYDQDYPSYIPDEKGKAFITKAREMGFHVAPHTNASQISPDHPLFFAARDFCTRSPDELRWGGWSWLPVKGWAAFGPPQSYSQMPNRKDWNILVNVHLAWSPWRRKLGQEVARLLADLKLDSVFVDVSQNIHNSDNAHLEGLSYAEGSLKLIRELSELAHGFCVSGEGRNEISTQYLSVTQFHLFNFAHVAATDGQDVSWVLDGTLPVNELLFKGLARGIGYSYGQGANRRVMIDATLKQGAIPTLIFQTPDPVSELDNVESQYLLSYL